MSRAREVSKIVATVDSVENSIDNIGNIDLSSTINTASAAAVAYLIDGAPAALNTLNELAAALNDNESFATTVTNELSSKLSISSASTIYLPQTTASATYLPLSGGTISGNLQVSGSSTFTGIIKNTNKPTFWAYFNGADVSLNTIPVIFAYTYVNVGNHYSTSTGRFTCPTNGLYEFYIQGIGNSTNGVYRHRLYKNGVMLDDIHVRIDTTDTGSAYGFGSLSVYQNAVAGDYFTVGYVGDSGAVATYGGTQYFAFGGTLIA
jgi:hypothetical protein